MTEIFPAITGLGYSVPNTIRTNNDPVFDWLKKNNVQGENLFTGYDERRVLSGNEDLLDIMLPAAEMAMKEAGIAAGDVDLLLGTGSISPYINPNILSLLHQELKLPPACWVIPLQSEFSNYNASLVMADALIRTNRFKNILVCVGGNWSRNVSYQTPQAVSAGDGAGAAVVSSGSNGETWSVVDQNTITASEYYGSMFTSGDCYELSPSLGSYNAIWTGNYFHITEDGLKGFQQFGAKASTGAVLNLLKNNGLTGQDITLISHQASAVLLNAWDQAIQPAEHINTLKNFGNMALANIPVTLAWTKQNQDITTKYLVLFSLGPDMHANAVLLRKGKSLR